jgi:hypothetical protein
MMGRQPDAQQKLFYTCLNLEKRIRKDHILRKIANLIDFDFISGAFGPQAQSTGAGRQVAFYPRPHICRSRSDGSSSTACQCRLPETKDEKNDLPRDRVEKQRSFLALAFQSRY